MVSTSSSAPSRDSRSESVPAVSVSAMGVSTVAATGPVSRPASMRMMQIPVLLSPRMIDHWMGAAPRNFGSREPCTFQGPRRGTSSTAWGRILP